MTRLAGNVRGAARPRGGATDTTMLIWKVINANPGIDRAGIWAKVEHGIPEGYALRIYHNSYCRTRGLRPCEDEVALRRARGFVLTNALSKMRTAGCVTSEGDGSGRRYTAARSPVYHGHPEAIDETGTKAAAHMALADARRTLKNLAARAMARSPKGGPRFHGSKKELDALVILLEATEANAHDKS